MQSNQPEEIWTLTWTSMFFADFWEPCMKTGFKYLNICNCSTQNETIGPCHSVSSFDRHPGDAKDQSCNLLHAWHVLNPVIFWMHIMCLPLSYAVPSQRCTSIFDTFNAFTLIVLGVNVHSYPLSEVICFCKQQTYVYDFESSKRRKTYADCNLTHCGKGGLSTFRLIVA